jgi:hypothetical protein
MSNPSSKIQLSDILIETMHNKYRFVLWFIDEILTMFQLCYPLK